MACLLIPGIQLPFFALSFIICIEALRFDPYGRLDLTSYNKWCQSPGCFCQQGTKKYQMDFRDVPEHIASTEERGHQLPEEASVVDKADSPTDYQWNVGPSDHNSPFFLVK